MPPWHCSVKTTREVTRGGLVTWGLEADHRLEVDSEVTRRFATVQVSRTSERAVRGLTVELRRRALNTETLNVLR